MSQKDKNNAMINFFFSENRKQKTHRDYPYNSHYCDIYRCKLLNHMGVTLERFKWNKIQALSLILFFLFFLGILQIPRSISNIVEVIRILVLKLEFIKFETHNLLTNEILFSLPGEKKKVD